MISEINIEKKDHYILYTTNYNIPIIMGNTNSVDDVLNFRAYWNKYSIYENKKNIEYIDLRYKDQVVVKKRN